MLKYTFSQNINITVSFSLFIQYTDNLPELTPLSWLRQVRGEGIALACLTSLITLIIRMSHNLTVWSTDAVQSNAGSRGENSAWVTLAL